MTLADLLTNHYGDIPTACLLLDMTHAQVERIDAGEQYLEPRHVVKMWGQKRILFTDCLQWLRPGGDYNQMIRDKT